MDKGYLIYGAAGSGSVPVEAALTLLGLQYEVVERPTWEPEHAQAIAEINPQRQIPALILPGGELMTESAAILIWLADSHRTSLGGGLSPALADPMRPRFLRWMTYISSQIYSLYWIRDDPSRLVPDKAGQALVRARTAARISACWAMMGQQVEPAGDYLLGDSLSVLDLYVAVVSRWGPRRWTFYEAAPNLAALVRRVDADPRLGAFWEQRFPFEPGWDAS